MVTADTGAVDICLDDEGNKVFTALLVTPLAVGFFVPLTLVCQNTKKSASRAAARKMKPVKFFAIVDLFVWEDAMMCGWTSCRRRDAVVLTPPNSGSRCTRRGAVNRGGVG